MFLQGDNERALGQPISPLMDRSKGGVTKSQTGFFKVVALPQFTVRHCVSEVHKVCLRSQNFNYFYVAELLSSGQITLHLLYHR